MSTTMDTDTITVTAAAAAVQQQRTFCLQQCMGPSLGKKNNAKFEILK